MKANEENGAAEKPPVQQDAASLFKSLLEKASSLSDPVERSATLQRVAELSQQATERAKLEMARRNEVTIGEDGQLVASNLAGLTEIGRFYAQSDLVPDHYKGNVGNCAIAFQMAKRMKLDPLTFMQQSYLVHGRPGIQAKLYIALLNTSPRLSGRLWYETERDQAGNITSCIACAKDADGAIHKGAAITPAMVKAEGWDRQKKEQVSKWVTIPEQMYRYRAASFLGNSDFPDVTLGLSTVEELEDVTGENATGANGNGNWVQPSSGSILGTGKPLASVAPAAAPIPETGSGIQTTKVEPPAADAATASQEIQPEYVDGTAEPARDATPERAHPVVEQVDREGPVAGYLTAIGMAQAPGGVDALVDKAGHDQVLNDSQFELVKVAAEKRKLNLSKPPAAPSGVAKILDAIRGMKRPAGIKEAVAKAEAAKLPKEDMELVYAEAARQNQKLAGGPAQPLLK